MSKTTNPLNLEEIVHLANEAGLEYVKAKKISDRLDMLKATVRSRIAEKYDDGSQTEARLRRLTDVDEEFVRFVEELVAARAESERHRIRYDSYKNLFQAKRSMLSYQKAEMKLV